MSVIERDFDRLALLDSDGWTHNNHYHHFLLQQVPDRCAHALEIGCGTGAFSRLLAKRAEQVVALDVSPEMIRVARSHSEQFPNIEFHRADVMSWNIPTEHCDYVVCIATLHHLPLRSALLAMKQALRQGGVLVILDLFEPKRLWRRRSRSSWSEALRDEFLNTVAIIVSSSLRLIHNGRLRPTAEVQAAWEHHGKHDSYPGMNEVRALCAELLPNAKVRRHLLWRYSITWQKT
jgi:ubiquinone/menaquinone biosynthesis C-methylase UbiE